jgi:hypothetical protein
LFALLVGFYHVNGVLALGNDMTANIALPTSLLNDGNLTFTVDEFPRMFKWRLETDEGPEEVYVHTWDAAVRGENATELRDSGRLEFLGPQYFLAETKTSGTYISAGGIGAGITALPAMLVLHNIFGDLRDYSIPALYAGKVTAAAAVAGSAVCIFLIASMYVRRNAALIVAMSYGLGTAVWSISSQGLWSHGPNELFLALGCYFLLRAKEAERFALFAGLAAGMALLCRPSSLVFALVAGLCLAYQGRWLLL